MAGVPQFCCHENVLPLDQAFVYGAPDALASLFFVPIVVRAVEQAIAGLDGLEKALSAEAEGEGLSSGRMYLVRQLSRSFWCNLPQTKADLGDLLSGSTEVEEGGAVGHCDGLEDRCFVCQALRPTLLAA
jgi:hypothetical protein